jgi:hypothetical protein
MCESKERKEKSQKHYEKKTKIVVCKAIIDMELKRKKKTRNEVRIEHGPLAHYQLNHCKLLESAC